MAHFPLMQPLRRRRMDDSMGWLAVGLFGGVAFVQVFVSIPLQCYMGLLGLAVVAGSTSWFLLGGPPKRPRTQTEHNTTSKAVAPPLEAKAFAQVARGRDGPSRSNNPNLKVLLTSCGLGPSSAPVQIEAYQRLAKSVDGKAILFLMDAKRRAQTFHKEFKDPGRYNQNQHVAYRREPDVPFGKPVYDSNGLLAMKTQEELLKMAYADATYALRTSGAFSKADLKVLIPGDAEVPIYFCYLWYERELQDGTPDYHILFARGYYRNGRFTAQRVGGEDFEESDYHINQEFDG
ncbi:unnamed protein product [Polarella glacialis]|uniref:Uncharacterized protein n=1 Tax=Polarella glacialis TaxID=89957 RepID=A0A813H082_POLGL|nr:unnamed protein product [Polarella glacialis]